MSRTTSLRLNHFLPDNSFVDSLILLNNGQLAGLTKEDTIKIINPKTKVIKVLCPSPRPYPLGIDSVQDNNDNTQTVNLSNGSSHKLPCQVKFVGKDGYQGRLIGQLTNGDLLLLDSYEIYLVDRVTGQEDGYQTEACPYDHMEHNVDAIQLTNGSIAVLCTSSNRRVKRHNYWIEFLDLTTKKQLLKYFNCQYQATCFLELDDQKIAIATSQGIIEVWSYKQGSCANRYDIVMKKLDHPMSADSQIWAWSAHNDKINGLLMLSNGNLVSYTDDSIKIWSANKYDCLMTLTGQDDSINKVHQLQNDDLIVFTAKQIKIWSNQGINLQTFTPGYEKEDIVDDSCLVVEFSNHIVVASKIDLILLDKSIYQLIERVKLEYQASLVKLNEKQFVVQCLVDGDRPLYKGQIAID